MPVVPAGPSGSGAMFRILAVVSTPIAVLAVIIAVIALVQAQSAKNRANNSASDGQPPAATTPGGGGGATEPVGPGNNPTDAPQPTSTPIDVLNPQATYTQHYADQTLNPQANNYNSAYIDLDEPRVAASSEKYDITLNGGSNATPYLTFRDGVSAAMASGASLQPRDCAELIRTGPLPEDSEVPAQRGTVLCLATSAQSAREQGIRQRMVVLRITDLSATGKVTMSLTAWEVPNN